MPLRIQPVASCGYQDDFGLYADRRVKVTPGFGAVISGATVLGMPAWARRLANVSVFPLPPQFFRHPPVDLQRFLKTPLSFPRSLINFVRSSDVPGRCAAERWRSASLPGKACTSL